MKKTFDDLPDWSFEVDEVSTNVYEVTGTDTPGHRVQMKGTDPDELLWNARQSASKDRWCQGSCRAEQR